MNIVISAISFTSFPKPRRTGKNSGIFLFAGALSQTSRSQRRHSHMAPRQPPPAGPARNPTGARPHPAGIAPWRGDCDKDAPAPSPLPPLSHLPWLSAKRCWQRCFPAPLTSSGSAGSGTAAGRHSEVRSLRETTRLLPLARRPPAHHPRLLARSPALPGRRRRSRTACSAAPRYSILRPAGSPGGLRARALLPPSPGGVAPRSGPAAPRRRRPRRAGHAGMCSPGMAPPHLAAGPQLHRVPREGRPLSASGRGRTRAGVGQSVPGGAGGRSPPGNARGDARNSRGPGPGAALVPRSIPRRRPGAALVLPAIPRVPRPGSSCSSPPSTLAGAHTRGKGPPTPGRRLFSPALLRPGLLAFLGMSKASYGRTRGNPISSATPLFSPL